MAKVGFNYLVFSLKGNAFLKNLTNEGRRRRPLKYTDWIYIGIPSIIIASLFTFATVDLNAPVYVWIYGWAILCLLYPIQFSDVPKQ